MKAIVELTKEELKKYNEMYDNLQKKIKGMSRDQLYTYSRRSGYAHYTFNGTYTEKLCEILGRTPAAEEIIMLVDGGFSHFGASCSVYDGHFTGRVNTD